MVYGCYDFCLVVANILDNSINLVLWEYSVLTRTLQHLLVLQLLTWPEHQQTRRWKYRYVHVFLDNWSKLGVLPECLGIIDNANTYIHVRSWNQLPKPKIYFPWRKQHENIPNTHVFAYFRYSLRSTLTYINMKTVRLYIQTAMNLQRKCLWNPDCKNMENTILYHFKWYMALWMWPKCPQYMQRTWWQTVATQHTGLT